jgi:hypothetical protein
LYNSDGRLFEGWTQYFNNQRGEEMGLVCVLLALLTAFLLLQRDPGQRLASGIGLFACLMVLLILFHVF